MNELKLHACVRSVPSTSCRLDVDLSIMKEGKNHTKHCVYDRKTEKPQKFDYSPACLTYEEGDTHTHTPLAVTYTWEQIFLFWFAI